MKVPPVSAVNHGASPFSKLPFSIASVGQLGPAVVVTVVVTVPVGRVTSDIMDVVPSWVAVTLTTDVEVLVSVDVAVTVLSRQLHALEAITDSYDKTKSGRPGAWRSWRSNVASRFFNAGELVVTVAVSVSVASVVVDVITGVVFLDVMVLTVLVVTTTDVVVAFTVAVGI